MAAPHCASGNVSGQMKQISLIVPPVTEIRTYDFRPSSALLDVEHQLFLRGILPDR